MKLWLSKNSEVPIREQLVAQISLGIASKDLGPDEKLPSTRELARRFRVHQNTVSAGYRELVLQGVIEFRKGSGFYVCTSSREKAAGLDRMIEQFLAEAARCGFTPAEIGVRIRERLDAKKPTGILLIESNLELRKILMEEVESATDCRVESISFETYSAEPDKYDLPITALFDKMEKIENVLPFGRTCSFLQANSVPSLMSGRSRPSSTDLTAIVSGWERFLSLAKLFLLAAGIDADTIITRSPDSLDWRSGIESASLIICDSLTIKHFPNDPRIRVFPLIADASLTELRSISIVQQAAGPVGAD